MNSGRLMSHIGTDGVTGTKILQRHAYLHAYAVASAIIAKKQS